jgi:hypothetical protein
MNWYLIGVAAIALIMTRRQSLEVRDGIHGQRRESVIAEDAFFGGFYFGIAVMCIVGGLFLWLNIL